MEVFELRDKEVKGVITVEMSYILSMILFVLMVIIYAVFYFHDKNILIGAAAETAVLGAQLERKPDENGQTDLNGFCRQRIAGKLILFGAVSVAVEVTDKWVTVSAAANYRGMSVTVKQKAPVLKPEKKIRIKEVTGVGEINSDGDGNGTE